MQIFMLVTKFIVLAIIYLFIFRIFSVILKDLRRNAAKGTVHQAVQAGKSGAELVVTESSDSHIRKGDVIHLGGETHIGRGAHNHIKLADSFVSHDHVQIILHNEKFLLEDLGSVNGTYINGVRVSEPTPLQQGDTIRIAGVTFKFVRWEYEME